MDKILQLLRDDYHQLNKINKTLFDSWQDKTADHFEKGCIQAINNLTKKYEENISQNVLQLNNIEKEVKECHERAMRLRWQ